MPEDGNDNRSYSGDELDRKLAELTSEIPTESRIREKSAAERAAAAAKARETADRADRKAARRSGRKASLRARGGKRPRFRDMATMLAVLVLIGGGVTAWLKISPPGGAAGTDDSHLVRNGPAPSTVSTQPAGPPSEPFMGTPAENYPEGAAGLAIPAAKPVGGFTAGQVRNAYLDARKLLVAALLDPRTLAGGAPNAFANLLVPQQRDYFVRGLDKIGLKQGYPVSTRTWVMSFAPGTTQLVTSVIKTDGTMSARTAAASGRTVLRIMVNALVVYVVQPPHQPSEWMRIVAHPAWQVDFAQYTDPGGALQPWLTRAGQAVAGALCGIGDGYEHPAYPKGPAPKVKPSGAPINPYSMATSNYHGCQATKGT